MVDGQVKSALFATMLNIVLVGAACVGGMPERDSVAEVVKAAESSGLKPYWVGSSFVGGGVEFRNAEGQLEDGVFGERLNNVELSYFAQEEFSVFGRLDVDTLPADSWPGAERRLFNIENSQTRVEQRRIDIAGRSASIYSTYFGEELNMLILAVPFEEMMVVASTSGSGEDEEPDPNPLMDEATFLSVLEDLRPYPE